MRQLINIHVASLVVLAAVLFGLGQPSLLTPLLVFLAAVLSLRYTDRQRRFHVGRLLVNGVIFGIAMGTAWRLVQAHGTLQTVVIGQALLALQVVLLFEAKSARTRWDLISLSLLTIFLATSFPHGPSFGLVLAVFFFFAFSTFSLLFFEREQQANDAAGLLLGDTEVAVAAGATTNWLRLVAVAFATLVVGPLALFLRFPDAPARTRREAGRGEVAKSGRWPLWGQTPRMNMSSSGALEAAATGREFRWRMARVTGVSIVLSLIVFCIAPRFGRLELELPQLSETPWKKQMINRRRAVGFSDRVRLGEMGVVTENQMRVLNVQFSDLRTGVPFAAPGGVYLRGAILTRYNEGHWNLAAYAPLLPLADRSSGQIVRQRIAIADLDDDYLFSVWPFVKINEERTVRFEVRSERLHRAREVTSRAFTYELGTSGFDDRVQADLIPCQRPIFQNELLQWPRRAMPKLAGLAKQWSENARISQDDWLGRARLLAANFRTSGRFEYRLDEPPRDASMDPIEDFVANHSQGNCEFFASALALMLRSQGIPSRLVVGYRAATYDQLSDSYFVRECDAHAWVEAYIPPEYLVGRELPKNHSDWSHGAWLRLESTPNNSKEVRGLALLTQQMRSAVDWMRSVWRDRVLGMSGSQQQASIYRPLVDALRTLGSQIADPTLWEGRRTPSLWNLGKGVLVLVWLACLALVAFAVLFGTRLRPLPRLGKRRPGSATRKVDENHRVAVAFYEQLEKLLAGHAAPRPSGQTQREFVQQAGEQIAAMSGERAVAAWSMEVVDAYYRVRFGQCHLDRPQAAGIEQLLRKIKKSVGNS